MKKINSIFTVQQVLKLLLSNFFHFEYECYRMAIKRRIFQNTEKKKWLINIKKNKVTNLRIPKSIDKESVIIF